MKLENLNSNSPEQEYDFSKYDFSKGVVLTAGRDMPLIGLKKGDEMKVAYDGLFLRKEPYVASPDQLEDQMNNGTWASIRILE